MWFDDMILAITRNQIAKANGLLKTFITQYSWDPDILEPQLNTVDKSGKTLLHYIGESSYINDLLKEKDPDAKTLIETLYRHNINPCIQTKKLKNTAIALATKKNHTFTAGYLFSCINSSRTYRYDLDHYLSLMVACVDAEGNNLLHTAIYHEDPNLIEAIYLIQGQKNREVLFALNKEHLTPLAIAMKKYREAPSALSKTFAIQIGLYHTKGQERTRMLEENVFIPNGKYDFRSKPIWKYCIEFCIKDRDGHKDIDFNWIDFMHHGLEDESLVVYKDVVTLELLEYYVDGKFFFTYPLDWFSKEEADLIKLGFKTQNEDFYTRTVAATMTNPALARNLQFQQRLTKAKKDFEQKANATLQPCGLINLGNANPHEMEPQQLSALLNHHKEDVILLYTCPELEKGFICYVPKPPAGVNEVSINNIPFPKSPKGQTIFNRTWDILREVPVNKYRLATQNELLIIMPLRKENPNPVQKPVQDDHRSLAALKLRGKNNVVIKSPAAESKESDSDDDLGLDYHEEVSVAGSIQLGGLG